MNIYVGCSQPLEESLLVRINQQIVGLDANYQCSSYRTMAIWENTTNRGETEFFENEDYQIILDGYLNNIQHPVYDHLPILAERLINARPLLEENETGVFNFCLFEKKTRNIYLAGDPSALFPLYYFKKQDRFWFSSHQYIFAESQHLKPDLVGIVENLQFSFPIGSRTLFEDLKRVNPGQVIIFRPSENLLMIRNAEAYYMGTIDHGRDLIDKTWDCLTQPFVTNYPLSGELGIMLSEGFDSRLVTGIAAQNNIPLTLYTHGTAGTLGSRISHQVAMAAANKYHFDSLSQGLPCGDNQLKYQLYFSDNLSIPYWIYGKKYFEMNKVDCVTTGYALDSTLGGNCFYKPNKPKWRAISSRYDEIIRQDLSLMTEDYIERISQEQISRIIQNTDSSQITPVLHYFFTDDIAEMMKRWLPQVAEDVNDEFSRIENTGAACQSDKLQRYFLEHVYRKHSFGQELTLRISNRLVIPSYEPVTMRFLSTVHPKYRLHHKLYLDVLKSHLPHMCKIPNGGYGISPIFPRVILETSRFFHKYQEQKIIHKYLKTRGNSDIRNLRTANFIENTYRKGQSLNYFREFISKNRSIFNEKLLIDKINHIQEYQSKSYQLMDFYRLVEAHHPLARL